ncbi:hypothetical protein FRC12_005347 [Ceratobasidium sp. 428]|nr:hypothetical protein FRC12_005347 [Ceratobasidium sp. 428]
MSLLSSMCRGWRYLKKGCQGVLNTIEDSFISLKQELHPYWDDAVNWISQPCNRNWLIVQTVKYSTFGVLLGGALVLLFKGPQGALIAGAWVGASKFAERYWGPFPLEGWFGSWGWLVRLAALGPTGLIWNAAEWVANGVSTIVQKIMEYFGAEF